MKFWRWSIGFLLSLIVLSVVLIWGVLDSGSANRYLLTRAAHYVDGLTIEGINGTVLNGLSIQTLRYQQGRGHLQFNQLKFKLDLGCLWSSHICVDQLRWAKANVNWPVSGEISSSHQKTDEQRWEPPWPIQIQQFNLHDTQLNIAGQAVSFAHFRGDISWDKRQISSQQLYLIHGKYQPSPSTASVHSSSRAQTPAPISLVDVINQLKSTYYIRVNKLQIRDSLIAGETPFKIDELQGGLRIDEQQLAIRKLQLVTSQGQLSTTLTTRFTSPYMTQFKVMGKDHAHQHATITAQGPLAKLRVKGVYQGYAKATLAGQFNALSSQFPYRFTMKLQQFQAVPASFQDSQLTVNVHGTKTGYQGQISGQSQVPLAKIAAISAAKVQTSVPSAQERIRLSGDFRGNWQALKHLQLVVSSATDSVQGRGHLSWQKSLSGALNLKTQHIALAHWLGTDWPTVSGHVRSSIKGQHWQISKLTLKGNWQQQPWQLNGHVKGLGEMINQLKLVGNVGSNRLNVQGQLTQQADLKGTLFWPKLAQIMPQWSGHLQGKWQLIGPRQSMRLKWKALGLKLAQADHQFSIARVNSDGTLQLNSQVQGQASLQAQQVRYGTHQLDSLSAEYSPQQGSQQLALSVERAKKRLAMVVKGQLHGPLWLGQLNRLIVDGPTGRYQLVNPAKLQLSPQRVHSQPICLREANHTQSRARICLNRVDYQPQQGFKITGAWQSVPLAPWIKWWQPQLQWNAITEGSFQFDKPSHGSLSGKLFVRSQKGKIHHLAEVANVSYDYQRLELRSEIVNDQLTTHVQFDSRQLGNIDLRAQFSIKPPLRQRSLTGQLNVDHLQLSPYQHLIRPLTALKGEIDGRIRLGGTVAHPQFFGPLRLKDGQIAGAEIPLAMDDVTTTLTFKGQRAQIKGQLLSHGHQLHWHGQSNWSAQQWRGNIAFNAKNIEIHYPPTDLVITPDINLRWVNNQVNLDGKVRVDKGTIKVNELPSQATALSKDVQIVDRHHPQDATENIGLNLSIDLGDALYLDAFGLTSQLVGRLTVKQPIGGELAANGQVTLQDGKFAAYGQHLQIQSGTLTFSGAPRSPAINVKAIREPSKTQDNVTVGITASGTPNQLLVQLFSTPSMGQNEQLSYLLRGHGLDDASGNDDALTSLLLSTGINQTGSLLSHVGNSVGIDQLNLSTQGRGDSTQVEVSGYVAPGIQVKYGRGMFESTNQVTLRYQLVPKFYLEMVGGVESAVDLYYEFSTD